MIFSWAYRSASHLEDETASTFGSSEESWSMNESLNQRLCDDTNKILLKYPHINKKLIYYF